jgi:stress response protein SCP2
MVEKAIFLGRQIMRRLAVTVVLLSLVFSSQVFGQSTNATVSGTVSDATTALVPAVTVTATNNNTGVVTTVLTNEAGAYNFASLCQVCTK